VMWMCVLYLQLTPPFIFYRREAVLPNSLRKVFPEKGRNAEEAFSQAKLVNLALQKITGKIFWSYFGLSIWQL